MQLSSAARHGRVCNALGVARLWRDNSKGRLLGWSRPPPTAPPPTASSTPVVIPTDPHLILTSYHHLLPPPPPAPPDPASIYPAAIGDFYHLLPAYKMGSSSFQSDPKLIPFEAAKQASSYVAKLPELGIQPELRRPAKAPRAQWSSDSSGARLRAELGCERSSAASNSDADTELDVGANADAVLDEEQEHGEEELKEAVRANTDGWR